MKGQKRMSTVMHVKKSWLVAKIEARRKSIVDEHAKATAAYEKEVAGLQARYVKALTEALRDAKAGRPPLDQYGELRIRVSRPAKPQERDNSYLDRDLELARNLLDESVPITVTSRFHRYL